MDGLNCYSWFYFEFSLSQRWWWTLKEMCLVRDQHQISLLILRDFKIFNYVFDRYFLGNGIDLFPSYQKQKLATVPELRLICKMMHNKPPSVIVAYFYVQALLFHVQL